MYGLQFNDGAISYEVIAHANGKQIQLVKQKKHPTYIFFKTLLSYTCLSGIKSYFQRISLSLFFKHINSYTFSFVQLIMQTVYLEPFYKSKEWNCLRYSSTIVLNMSFTDYVTQLCDPHIQKYLRNDKLKIHTWIS